MGSNEFSYLPFKTQNLWSPSVADQNTEYSESDATLSATLPERHATSTNYSFDFFGTTDPSSALIANDRWTTVGTYSLLFFSFILNVFLLLKLWNYRRRKFKMT